MSDDLGPYGDEGGGEPDRAPLRLDPRAVAFAQEFGQLTDEDQNLVMALVARLRGQVEEEFPPDVAFMDFDE